jgi:hypothetical protein
VHKQRVAILAPSARRVPNRTGLPDPAAGDRLLVAMAVERGIDADQVATVIRSLLRLFADQKLLPPR